MFISLIAFATNFTQAKCAHGGFPVSILPWLLVWFPDLRPAGVGFLLAVWVFYSTVCCIVKQSRPPVERLLLESEVM